MKGVDILLACPVCFGKTDDAAGMISGLTWGLFILLLATFGILGGLAYAVAQIEKRRALRESTHLTADDWISDDGKRPP